MRALNDRDSTDLVPVVEDIMASLKYEEHAAELAMQHLDNVVRNGSKGYTAVAVACSCAVIGALISN